MATETTQWNDEAHREFYQRLRVMNKEEQSNALLNQAEMLLENCDTENDDFIKAAESLLIYWTTKININEDRFKAQALLSRVQAKLRG